MTYKVKERKWSSSEPVVKPLSKVLYKDLAPIYHDGGAVERAEQKANNCIEFLGKLVDQLAEKKDLFTEDEWEKIMSIYGSDEIAWVNDE